MVWLLVLLGMLSVVVFMLIRWCLVGGLIGMVFSLLVENVCESLLVCMIFV